MGKSLSEEMMKEYLDEAEKSWDFIVSMLKENYPYIEKLNRSEKGFENFVLPIPFVSDVFDVSKPDEAPVILIEYNSGGLVRLRGCLMIKASENLYEDAYLQILSQNMILGGIIYDRNNDYLWYNTMFNLTKMKPLHFNSHLTEFAKEYYDVYFFIGSEIIEY
jgi:hypothetical protein